MSIRIALAEDHPVLWAGLRDLLASEAGASVVGDAGTGEAALALVTRGRPGVLLLDLRLPDAAGLNLIEPALAAVPDLRVIVFWSRATGEDLRRAFQTGAAGFLAKDTDGEAVIGAVRTVARGESVVGAALSGRLVDALARPGPTAQELDVLREVARGGSNRAIVGALGISEPTVRVHLNHVFEKLGVGDRTAAVTTALQRGVIDLG